MQSPEQITDTLVGQAPSAQNLAENTPLNFEDDGLVMIDEANDESPQPENPIFVDIADEEEDDEIEFLGQVNHTAVPPVKSEKRKRLLNDNTHSEEVVEIKRQRVVQASGDGQSSTTVVQERSVRQRTATTSKPASPDSDPSVVNLSSLSKWQSRDHLDKHAKAPKLDDSIWAQIQAYRNKYPKKFVHFDQQIMRHYVRNIQNDLTYFWKMQIRKSLLECIQQIYFGAQLFVVGSTINGCGSLNADMDLCCSIPDEADSYDQRKFALKALRKIKTLLYRNRLVISMKNCLLISAKVPILRITFYGPHENLEVDLNVNNFAGVYNSYLVHYYSRIDDRFPALCLLVKHWAKRNQIGEAVNGTLNSYSIILLVIHFLQAAISPPILPNLQETFPHLFTENRPLEKCALFQELDKIYPDPTQNKRTVGELLIAFFDYYSKFDFENWAISVSRACIFPRYELPNTTERFKIFIEEPYDKNNTARCVTQELNFDLIVDTFKSARSWFLGKRRPDCRHIGVTEVFMTD